MPSVLMCSPPPIWGLISTGTVSSLPVFITSSPFSVFFLPDTFPSLTVPPISTSIFVVM